MGLVSNLLGLPWGDSLTSNDACKLKSQDHSRSNNWEKRPMNVSWFSLLWTFIDNDSGGSTASSLLQEVLTISACGYQRHAPLTHLCLHAATRKSFHVHPVLQAVSAMTAHRKSCLHFNKSSVSWWEHAYLCLHCGKYRIVHTTFLIPDTRRIPA